MRLGEQLLADGRVTPSQLRMGLAYQQRWQCRLGEALVASHALELSEFLRLMERRLGVRSIDVAALPIADETVALVPTALIVRHCVLPVATKGPGPRAPIILATAEPQNLRMLDDISFALGRPVLAVLAWRRDIEAVLRQHGIIAGRPFDPLDVPEEENELELMRGGEHDLWSAASLELELVVDDEKTAA